MRLRASTDVDWSGRADLEWTGEWLRRHGLGDEPPTPLLAARLRARRWTRLTAQVVLAVFICVVALVYVHGRRSGGLGGHRPWSLLTLTGVVVALVASQAVLAWWVRRVDRHAGATLSRRVTQLGRVRLLSLLGWPRALFTLATLAGTAALAVAALTASNSTTRYAGVVLLLGLAGIAVDRLLQLRQILLYPVVADDEVSLTADVMMRVEDTRDAAAPTILWALPMASVYGTGLGWWNDAWLAFVVLGAVTFAVIQMRTPGIAATARRATSGPAT